MVALLFGMLGLHWGMLEPGAIFVFFLFFGALLPDIDHVKSKVSQKLKMLSGLLQYITGHRGFIHSITGMVVFGIPIGIIGMIIEADTLYPFLIGYGSHLLIDSLTVHGTKVLYPLPYKIRGPVKTGSWTERIIFTFFLILAMLLAYA